MRRAVWQLWLVRFGLTDRRVFQSTSNTQWVLYQIMPVKRRETRIWWRNSINSLLSSNHLFYNFFQTSFRVFLQTGSILCTHYQCKLLSGFFLLFRDKNKCWRCVEVGSWERACSPSAVKPWKDWLVAARSGWDPPLAGLGKLHAARTSRGPSAAGTGEGCEKFLKRDRCAVVQGRLSLMNKDALVLKSSAVAKGYGSMCLASRHLLWELLTMGWFWIRGEDNFAGELF